MKILNNLNKKLLCCLLSLGMIIPTLSVPTTVSAADNSSYYQYEIRGGEYDSKSNLMEVLMRATPLNKGLVGGVLFLPVVTEVTSDGKSKYDGTIGAAFKITTDSAESYYTFSCMNRFCYNPITYTLYDSRGIQVAFDDSKTYFSLRQSTENNPTVKLDGNSTYYVLITTKNGETLDESCFGTLSYNSITDDYGSDFTKASYYTIGSTITHNFEGYKDSDVFTFTTGASKGFYHFTVTTPSTSTNLTDTLNIYDSSYRLVYSIEAKAGTSSSKWFPLDSNATYYIVMKPKSDNTTGIGTFSSSFLSDTVNDTYDTATEIEKETTVSNSIECELDTDVFKFNTGNTTSLTLSVTNDNTSSGSVSAAVYDSNGGRKGSVSVPIGQTVETSMAKYFAPNTYYYLVVTGSKNSSATYSFKLDRCVGNIKYETDGGTLNKNTISTYKAGDKVTLYKPIKKGYVFAGWYTDKKYTNKLTSLSPEITNDNTIITVYAKWKDAVNFTYKKGAKITANKIKGTTASISIPKGYIKSSNTGSGKKVYEILYSTSKNFKNAKTVTISTDKKSATLKKLSKNKTYYVKVRMSYQDKDGKWKVYSKPSSDKVIKFTTLKK